MNRYRRDRRACPAAHLPGRRWLRPCLKPGMETDVTSIPHPDRHQAPHRAATSDIAEYLIDFALGRLSVFRIKSDT